MTKQSLLLLALLYVLALPFKAEPMCHFRHYSTDDGLPQYTIMDIIQDKKGYLWFATWDGLSKFDGYNFKNYKSQPTDKYYIASNRIQRLYHDKYGRIWFQSYEGGIHCFNPTTEKFWGPRLSHPDINYSISDISIKPSGKVWLLTKNNGCILVEDSLFATRTFNIENNSLKSRTVNDVFEDNNQGSWILTDNGIEYVSADNKTKSYFTETIKESNNNKQSFFSGLDLGEELWFGSQNGRIWRFTKKTAKNNLLQFQFASEITSMLRGSDNEVLVFSKTEGFALFNLKTNDVKYINSSRFPQLTSNRIVPILTDGNGNIWFETDELGIYRFNLTTHFLKKYNAASNDPANLTFPPMSKVVEDINGRLWIQPKGGGFSLYNNQTDALDPFFNEPSANNWRFSNIIHSVYSDTQGNLWMCTRSHGLEKIVFDKNYFETMSISTRKIPDNANDVRAVFEDKDKHLWVATKDRRLTIYDHKRNKLGEMSAEGKISQSNALLPANVYCITQDKEGNMWLGTKGGGLILFRKTNQRLTFSPEYYKNDVSDIYSLSDNSIYSIFQDSQANIWLGTYGGGINLVEKKQGKIRFINHRNHLKNYPVDPAFRVRYITETKKGNLCVGTTNGMVMFSSKFNLPENIKFHMYTVTPGNPKSLSNNDIHGICISQNEDIYIATFGGGINKASQFDKYGFPTTFKAYTTLNGLPSDVTLALVEDTHGKIWVSTENSLTKFDPQLEVFETFDEIRRLMTIDNFSEASNLRLHNNHIVFGYSGGLITFSPERINNSDFKPYIAFSNFQLFNKNVPIDEDSPLKVIIDDIQQLVLTHKQKFFSLEYAALDFVDPENILYAYKLEGFDKDWNYVQKQRIANYTNLPKGEYIFKVKSTNSEGVWVENERQLNIQVLPSFWETGIAYFIYILLFVALIYSLVRILLVIYGLKENVELEKKISEMKLRFFTDISHEIRTPLTMITAPVDYMLNDPKTPENMKSQLKMISQNTNRMLRLVNQILDFRRIQFLHLKVQEIELASIAEEICDSFMDIAHGQKIRFSFSDNSGNAKIWADPDCIEKILMNLLSNAFKYTPSGKAISVIINNDDNTVSMTVSDEGTGISKEKQKRLFTRFASFNEDKSKPSTGIGLNVVRDLAEKHGAKIEVDSDEGKGSVFTILFQKGHAHFGNDVEIIAAEHTKATAPFSEKNADQISGIDELNPLKQQKQSVLIVEDDPDLRAFIRTILEEDYLTIEAEDGVYGMEKALQYCPDFIVSDIMMPRRDGVELLQLIRKDINTSHIPVILLTAKTTLDSKLEGLAYGADDYITKPFSVTYFKARVANLLQQRSHLQEVFRNSLTPSSAAPKEYEPQPFIIASQDEIMMTKIMELIEKNMENSDFSVEEMGQYVGMSRSVFFKKLKSLTGLSPVEFVRDIKMKRAAQLLESGQLMIKEVSFMVGISDTRYFSKCFKAKYGMIPLEYKNKMVEKNNSATEE